jgi:hypothetical protein
MPTKKPSRNAVDGKIHIIRRGLAVYKVNASPFYRVRIRLPSTGKYLVRSTKAISKISAIAAAEEFFEDLRQSKFVEAVPKSYLFATFADKLIDRQNKLAADGKLHPRQASNDRNILLNKGGLVPFFGRRDITTIRTNDITAYLEHVRRTNPNKLTPSTLNKKIIAFRKVLKIAYEDGVIENLPLTPLVSRQDNPRPYFSFSTNGEKGKDDYSRLLKGARGLADKGVLVRGVPITSELYDFILFMTHSFLRPVESEIFALQHKHVQIATDPDRLILTITKGKTGYRQINTLSNCVVTYKRICERQVDRTESTYLFFPEYKNRRTAIAVLNRQFNHLLDHIGLKFDPITQQKHTVYSLRHTALVMRILKSEGEVNILNLAKTAGTSIETLERFYLRRLPLSPEMARNLQAFGKKK